MLEFLGNDSGCLFINLLQFYTELDFMHKFIEIIKKSSMAVVMIYLRRTSDQPSSSAKICLKRKFKFIC